MLHKILNLPKDILDHIYSYDDYYRIIFRRDVIPSLLIRSTVFLRHQLYEQTKKSYLFSYTVSLSDFDCFHLQYFLDNEHNN